MLFIYSERQVFSVKYCINCGEKLPDTAKFCVKCGTPSELIECPHCGEILSEGTVYCSKCGTKITEAEPPQPKVNVKITRLSKDENIPALVSASGEPLTEEPETNFIDLQGEDGQRQDEAPKKKPRKAAKYLIIGVICVAAILLVSPYVDKEITYQEARDCMQREAYAGAAYKFESLGDYKDSEELLKEARYRNAIEWYVDSKYDAAQYWFNMTKGYKLTDWYLEQIEQKLNG